MFTRKRLVGLLLVLLVIGGVTACLLRSYALSWYYVHQLVRVNGSAEEQALWADRAAQMGEASVPRLLDHLQRQDPLVCSNAQAALERLADQWGADDPRQAALMTQLAESFPQLSAAGQGATLELEARWLKATPKQAGWKVCAARLLTLGGQSADAGVRRRALGLASVWMKQPSHAEAAGSCRELTRQCLHDADASTRAEAVSLAALPDVGLVREVVSLLEDPAAEVRQAAMAAVGSSEEVVATDDLLHALHDPDAEVRRMCEAALRGRGLVSNQDLAMARLISDAKPGVRLQVLDRLARAADLEPGVWLRRLSQDPAPAVRAAAVRAAAELEDVDLSDRLEKMVQQDPSDTVRQLAQHYLNRHKSLQKMKFDR